MEGAQTLEAPEGAKTQSWGFREGFRDEVRKLRPQSGCDESGRMYGDESSKQKNKNTKA